MRFNHKTLLAVFLFLLPVSGCAKDYPEVSKSEHPVFGKQLLEIDPPVETSGAIISPDGMHIASAGPFGNQFFLWDAKTGDRIFRRKLAWDAVPPGPSILFTPDSKSAIYPALETGDQALLDMDISFDIFNAENGNKVTAIKGSDRSLIPQAWNTASTIAISRDGNRIISGMLSRYAVFSKPDWNMVSTGDATSYPIGALALSNDGTLIALGYFEGQVEIRNALTGKINQTIQAHLGRISKLIFSKDGKRLFTSSEMALWHGPGEYTPELQQSDNEDARAWDVITGKRIGTYSYVGQFGAADIALSPDEKTLIVAKHFRNSGRLLAFDVSSNHIIDQLDTTPAPLRSVSFTADGKTLCTAAGNVIVTMNVNNQGN